MTTYRVTMSGGWTFHFSAKLAEPSAPIAVNFHDVDDDEDWQPTPYQTANACHDARRAAELLAAHFATADDADDDEVESVEALDEIPEDVAEIAELIHGTNGDPGDKDDRIRVAEDWIDCGFDRDDVNAWLAAGCFDADAAKSLSDTGVTPEQAATQTDETVGVGHYAGTIGYKVANGDLTTADALELLGIEAE